MDDLERRITTLSAEKRELFENLLKQQRLKTEPAPTPQNFKPDATAAAMSLAQQSQAETGDSHDISSMQFSLFFFSEDGSEARRHKYQQLLEAAKFGDENGFSAIWTPERHFDAFGGPYPNPSVLMAALAMITSRMELRAGSVVLPLHHPLRVVEEWAVVDNLSDGRVALSFASGWHRDDFIFAPDKYGSRKETLVEDIQTVQRLWEGEAFRGVGVDGSEVTVHPYPRPVRHPLPVWLTSAGSPDTFKLAGSIGANLLTGLTGQNVEGLAQKLKLYRESLEEHGHDPADKKIALMLHTYLGRELDEVREEVRPHMYEYLKTNLTLHEKMAKSRQVQISSQSFTGEDQEALLAYSFERYFEGGSLLGTVETGKRMVARLKAIGVTEIACLIDFGLEHETVMSGLRELKELKDLCRPVSTATQHAPLS